MSNPYLSLQGRAQRALGTQRVDQALAKVRAIIGPHNIPDSEEQAQAALDKLQHGDTPTAEELMALEVVVRLMRPVVYSRGGQLDDLPESPGHNLYPQDLKDAWARFRTRVVGSIGSIGRIETLGDGRHIGTGFVAAAGLIATNRHVLDALTFGTGVLPPNRARIVYKQEIDATNPPSEIVAIDGVHARHPSLDMVLLRVADQTRAPVAFEEVLPAEGMRVVVIGFPGRDPVNNPLFLSGVFQDGFGVKRAALGEILDGSDSSSIYHDCSTTQGNSGSPVFSLDTGRVTGIHRAGFFMYRNEALVAEELRILANPPQA